MFLRLLALLSLSVASVIAAETPATNAPPLGPALSGIRPIAFTAGVTNKITVIGSNLTEVTKIALTGESNLLVWSALSGFSPVREGETNKAAARPALELEATFFLPPDVVAGTNWTLVASNAAGVSRPWPLYVAPHGKLVEERSPNEGFLDAQPIDPGAIILGALSQTTDVDVFKLAGHKGQTVRAEVFAARLGGVLDASLTLYDRSGVIIGSNDDAAGLDAILTAPTSIGGDYFIVLSAVADIPAKTNAPYVLEITLKP